VLADVLERDGTEESALEVQRASLASLDHLARLDAIWRDLTAEPNDRRYRDIVSAELPRHYRDGVLSHQSRWLFRTLRAAECAGLNARQVVAQAVAERDLAGARDVASVLDARIRQRIAGMVPAAKLPWSARAPRLADPNRDAYLAQIARMMDERKDRIGEFAARQSPAWAVNALGPVPDDPLYRLEWQRRASSVGAYRELYGYGHPADPIGPEPACDAPEKRAAWHEAFTALRPASGPDVRMEPDDRLWRMRETYQNETSWAPRHVGRELRLVRIGADEARIRAIRETAEAQAADGRDPARHARLAESFGAIERAYRDHEQALAAHMADRREWEQATEESRRLGVAADWELRRRHPEQRLEPLRSAEPEPPAERERQQLEIQPGSEAAAPEWVSALAAERDAFREKADAYKGMMVPSEDPDWQDLGEAWTSPQRQRDAILQPPKPEIGPSPRAAAMAAERSSQVEAEAGA
jgi:hypothetical protein